MILITMAGLSSRFSKAGYSVPKYALEYDGRSIFEWAVRSFEKYFQDEFFLFVLRPDEFAATFVENSVKDLGIKKYRIIRLDRDTRGQAETAYLALKEFNEDFPVIIFNIDTIRYGYIKPEFLSNCDGYLEVFRGEGSHWSFVEPGPDLTVTRTTEKERISDLCSDGLYYFKSHIEFCRIFEDALNAGEETKGEFYIAPLYNKMIKAGAKIKYDVIEIDQIDFCGTPSEYENLLEKRSAT
ncbi:glycosyltransferase family 2 protein [Comamonas thiooxydans]|uniref:glycosyltransferase family 2 protein n=1 Tax=Comamonas thiooxydans TaxID=363952 RepID=UPI0009EE6F3B|nr:glycosyltransferase family 2 protein [Comamonas thiooxydans]